MLLLKPRGAPVQSLVLSAHREVPRPELSPSRTWNSLFWRLLNLVRSEVSPNTDKSHQFSHKEQLWLENRNLHMFWVHTWLFESSPATTTLSRRKGSSTAGTTLRVIAAG